MSGFLGRELSQCIVGYSSQRSVQCSHATIFQQIFNECSMTSWYFSHNISFHAIVLDMLKMIYSM
uniref:Uncharacterized protein n=1 Tax=Anguilla anguilla TaxID=7936 RepID=A0A0E9SUL4_ANGAN